MRQIFIKAANRTYSGCEIEPTTIIIEGEVSSQNDPLHDFFNKQAEVLSQALIDTLPQGTLHVLTGLLLKKVSSEFIGTCKRIEGV